MVACSTQSLSLDSTLQGGFLVWQTKPTSSRLQSNTSIVLPLITFFPMMVASKDMEVQTIGVPFSVVSGTSPLGNSLANTSPITLAYYSYDGTYSPYCIFRLLSMRPNMLPPISTIFAPSSFAYRAIISARFLKNESPRA